MKKIINWIKNLFIQYKITETYYIDIRYSNLESIKEFIKYRKNRLKQFKCKCEIIYLTDPNFNEDVIGMVECKHYKYNVKEKALLKLKNGLIYWKFI